MSSGLRLVIRILSRLIGIAVGFVVYRDYGLWPAFAAGVVAWLIVGAVIAVVFGRMKAKEYIITPADAERMRDQE